MATTHDATTEKSGKLDALTSKLESVAAKLTAYTRDIDLTTDEYVVNVNGVELRLPLALSTEQVVQMKALSANSDDSEVLDVIGEVAGKQQAEQMRPLPSITVAGIMAEWGEAIAKVQGVAMGE